MCSVLSAASSTVNRTHGERTLNKTSKCEVRSLRRKDRRRGLLRVTRQASQAGASEELRVGCWDVWGESRGIGCRGPEAGPRSVWSVSSRKAPGLERRGGRGGDGLREDLSAREWHRLMMRPLRGHWVTWETLEGLEQRSDAI